MIGEIALGLCVIAVAFLGALMLTGRLPIREGARIVIGCFILLLAPVIATGLISGGSAATEVPAPPPDATPIEDSRSDLPPADFDPYAGASVGAN